MATQNSINVGVVAGGGQTYTFPAATDTLVARTSTDTMTNKTLTSPVVSGAGGTTAGKQGYDATNLALLVGDGTANQSIFTSAWKAFTPSWTGITVGNGTNTGAYAQYGKLVVFKTYLKFGTTTSVSTSVTFTFPITIASYSGATIVAPNIRLFSGGAVYRGDMPSSGAINVLNASGTYLSSTAINTTTPGTWTTNDEIEIQGYYEAA